MRENDLKRQLAAECLGTFAIVLFGCGAIMIAERFPGSISATGISATFGLVVAAMIYCIGHISGAHMNPAVSLAFSISRHFPVSRIFPYWAAQTFGAFLAIALLHVTLPTGLGYGATHPSIPTAAAFVWEFVLTYILMFVIMGVATDSRAVGTMAGAAIGATVMLEALVAGRLTGASMNPARSIAPLVAEGRFDLIWLYVLAPMLGAVSASVSYTWIKGEKSQTLEV